MRVCENIHTGQNNSALRNRENDVKDEQTPGFDAPWGTI